MMNPLLSFSMAALLIWISYVLPALCMEIDESEQGDFIFQSRNAEFGEECHSPAREPSKGSKPECLDSILMNYMYSLQVINPESVIALATKNKLEKICTNMSHTMDRMQKYLKTCALQPQQEEFAHLLKGVTTLHTMLCTRDPYQRTFMEHKKCLAQLQSEFGSCNGPADWTDNADGKKVCKAYQEIADCYYIKTSVLCGNVAADVFKELVNAVIDSVITVDCSNNTIAYHNLNKSLSSSSGLSQTKLNIISISFIASVVVKLNTY